MRGTIAGWLTGRENGPSVIERTDNSIMALLAAVIFAGDTLFISLLNRLTRLQYFELVDGDDPNFAAAVRIPLNRR